MLMRLGRWLRAAGHDVLMFPAGTPDRRLLAAASRDGRLLVTRDRKLMELRDAPATQLLLRSNDTEACARELTARCHIDWLFRPFSRCLLCNALLQPGSDAEL